MADDHQMDLITTTTIATTISNNDNDYGDFGNAFDNTISGNILQTLLDARLLFGSLADAYQHLEELESPNSLEPWRIYRKIMEQIGQQFHSLGAIVLKIQKHLLTEQCAHSLGILLDDLRDGKLWAWRMLDSTGLGLHPGVTNGPWINLGAFDQCIDLDRPVRGQYCLIEMSMPRMFDPSKKNRHPDLGKHDHWNGTIWAELWALRSYLEASRIYLSICVPAQCTEQEVWHAVQWLQLSEHSTLHCQTGLHIGWTLLLGSVALSLLFTAATVSAILARLLAIGSPMATTTTLHAPVQCRPLAGIQVVILLVVMHFHTYMFTRKMTMQQVLPFLEHNPRPMTAIRYLALGWPLVDAWLTVEAIDHSYQLLRDPNGTVLGRYLWLLTRRWAAVVALIIAMVLALPVVARGPLSALVTPRCAWWQPLLFSADPKCLPHLWPVAVELFLYPLVLVPGALFLAWRRPSVPLTVAYTAGPVLAHGLLLSVAFYLRRWSNLLTLATGPFHSEISMLQKLLEWNTGAWLHVAPYLIGCATGYLLANRRTATSHWILATTIIITGISLPLTYWFMALWLRWQPNTGRLVASLWLGLHRISFGLMIACFVMMAHRTDFLRSWLSIDPLHHMARIRHQWYLWHYIVLIVRDARRRQPLQLGHWAILEESILNATFSFFLAYGCQKFLTDPIITLARSLWRWQRNRSRNRNNKPLEGQLLEFNGNTTTGDSCHC